ncbi:keratin, type II cytoskeletal 1b [Drosophila rhopaloa]|uniref:Uncharacterized protein n=1 Tax=Drosophila rhopaloa TaxID=1041015 RepID=A0ABM5I6S6_DRORH|nr:keratin, type II cytoskeletal 1b [Drosophila rhopaloa]
MRHLTALAVLAFSALAFSEAAVYIGGGCYDCNPPGGQGPGVYTGVNGGRGGGGGGGSYYNNGGGGGGGGGRPVYSGNFGPGYSNGGGGVEVAAAEEEEEAVTVEVVTMTAV